MKQSLKFILGFLFISVFHNNCNQSGTDSSYGNRYLLTASSPRIGINHIWTNLGDHLGKENQEMGLASVDVAEFSNQLKYIVSRSSLGYDLIVWEVSSGKKIWEYQCKDEIETGCFSPEDKYVLAGGKFNTIYIWQVNDWTLHKQLDFDASVEYMTFSNNNEYLAIGLGNGKIKLFHAGNFEYLKTSTHTPKEVMDTLTSSKNRADVNSLDFSLDDQYLVSGGMDGKIKVWRVEDMSLVKTLAGHDASIKSVRIHPRNKCIASASVAQEEVNRMDNSIKIWDFETGDLIHTLTFPLGMEAVDFSPDGNYLAGGGREGFHNNDSDEEQGHFYFYNIPEDPINQPIMQVHKEPVFRSEYLHFSNDGSMLVSSHEDGTVRLWNVEYFK